MKSSLLRLLLVGLFACTKANTDIVIVDNFKDNKINFSNSLKRQNDIILNSYQTPIISVGYYKYLYKLHISVTNIPNFSYGGSMTYKLNVSGPGGLSYSQEVNTQTVEIFANLNDKDVVIVSVEYADYYGAYYFEYRADEQSPNPPNPIPLNPIGNPEPITPAPWGSGFTWNITSNTMNSNVTINWNWQNGHSYFYYYFLFQVYNPQLNHYYTIYDSASVNNNTKTITVNRFYTSYDILKIDFWAAGSRYTPRHPANEYYPGNPQESRYIAMGGNVGQFYTRGFVTYSFPFVLNGFPPSE